MDDSKTGPATDPRSELVIIAHADLSVEALRGVVDAFVLREGTDYGRHETDHETKVRQVIEQIERGEARIVYAPCTRSVDIVPTGSLVAPGPGGSGRPSR